MRRLRAAAVIRWVYAQALQLEIRERQWPPSRGRTKSQREITRFVFSRKSQTIKIETSIRMI